MDARTLAAFLSAGALLAALSGSAVAQTTGGAVGGSGGSAAAGGTSASTLGVGGTSTGPSGSASALGMAGSAAAVDGSTQSRAAVHGNRNLNGQAMAQAHDGGTFSKSHTHCKDQMGQDVDCRTKSMAHVPGEKPVMSTSDTSSSIPH